MMGMPGGGFPMGMGAGGFPMAGGAPSVASGGRPPAAVRAGAAELAAPVAATAGPRNGLSSCGPPLVDYPTISLMVVSLVALAEDALSNVLAFWDDPSIVMDMLDPLVRTNGFPTLLPMLQRYGWDKNAFRPGLNAAKYLQLRGELVSLQGKAVPATVTHRS